MMISNAEGLKSYYLDYQNYYHPVQQAILQTNGVAMGSSLAPLLADLYMNWIIDQTKQIRPQPTLFYRYVDDYFSLFSRQENIF